MHELTVIENIMKISLEVAKENQLSQIDKINLTVGKMQHLNEMILQNGFEAVKEKTPASEANLVLEWKPVRLSCNDCNHKFQPSDHNFSCPVCRSGFTEVIQGYELFIKSIEGQ
jgi:hydrogenase nickel incorporation protein HypA/HybF